MIVPFIGMALLGFLIYTTLRDTPLQMPRWRDAWDELLRREATQGRRRAALTKAGLIADIEALRAMPAEARSGFKIGPSALTRDADGLYHTPMGAPRARPPQSEIGVAEFDARLTVEGDPWWLYAFLDGQRRACIQRLTPWARIEGERLHVDQAGLAEAGARPEILWPLIADLIYRPLGHEDLTSAAAMTLLEGPITLLAHGAARLPQEAREGIISAWSAKEANTSRGGGATPEARAALARVPHGGQRALWRGIMRDEGAHGRLRAEALEALYALGGVAAADLIEALDGPASLREMAADLLAVGAVEIAPSQLDALLIEHARRRRTPPGWALLSLLEVHWHKAGEALVIRGLSAEDLSARRRCVALYGAHGEGLAPLRAARRGANAALLREIDAAEAAIRARAPEGGLSPLGVGQSGGLSPTDDLEGALNTVSVGPCAERGR
ncbi:hypothetical protein KKB55_20045 [Myxococcota bacterium]|nr:hypothetical protein [Myxococcota bacterium]